MSKNRFCQNIQAAGINLPQQVASRRHRAFEAAIKRKAVDDTVNNVDDEHNNDEEDSNTMDDHMEEGHDFDLDPETVTQQLIFALRSAGPQRTPPPESGMHKILKVILQPGFTPDLITVKSGKEVNRYVDNFWISEDGAFLRLYGKMVENGDPSAWGEVPIYGTDPLEALKDMVGSKEAEKNLFWETQPEGEGIDGPMTAARVRRRQARVREEFGDDTFLLPFIVYSDSTHLDSKGHHKGHPVMVKLAGWKKEFWLSYRATRLVMLFPETPTPADLAEDDEGQPTEGNRTSRKEHIKHRKYEIFHHAVDMVFANAKKASYGYGQSSYRPRCPAQKKIVENAKSYFVVI